MTIITNKAGQTGFNSSQEEEENEGESDDDPSLGNLEGVALVSLATGIIVRLNPDKIYLDSCASHIQLHTLLDIWGTLLGRKLGSMPSVMGDGGQNTACEIGMLIGAIKAWLVRSGRGSQPIFHS